MSKFDRLPDRTGTGAYKWEARTEAEKQNGIVAMSVADMELPAPECVQEEIRRMTECGVYGYTSMDERYVLALQSWMRSRHGWEVKKEEIVPIHGVVPAIAMCVQAYTQVSDGVIIQPPVYPPFRSVVNANGRRVIENPLIYENGRYRMDYEDLAKKASDPRAKLLILCSPHNPVGRVWEKEELEKLHSICAENGVIVVSDEIHFDLVKGAEHTVYAKVDPDAVVMTAPSKTFNVPGLSLSNMVIANEERREAMKNTISACGGSGVPYFGRAALCAAYEKGAEWLDEVLDYIQGNCDALEAFLAEHFPQVKLVSREGTYLLWADCTALGIPEEELLRFLREEAGWIVQGGSGFGEQGRGFVRINAALPRPELEKAMKRLLEAVEKRG